MSGTVVRVVLLRVAEDLTEARMAPLLALLDDGEKACAARFAFARLRMEYVAAHALTRLALARATGAGAAAFRFRSGPTGKPEPLLDGSPVPVAFNLSHTAGMVGVAVAAAPGLRLGFDLERAERRVGDNLAQAIFRPEELRWLASLPAEARGCGMMRLWTLTEAFIKATGRGLSEDLTGFWFMPPSAIHFARGSAEAAQRWSVGQRLVGGEVFAAVAASPAREVQITWEEQSIDEALAEASRDGGRR